MKVFTKINNYVIVILILFVMVVGFYPQPVVPISVDDDNAIYNGKRQGNGVSLMFNVYENTKIVEQILTTLKKHNASATFFVGGCWADDNKETLLKILENGNELGNHGYFHKDHKKLSEKVNIEEINCCHEVVKALCGYEMKLFAPPSGSFSSTTLKCADKLGYKTIMWTKDTIDWRDNNVELIIKRATNNLSAGDFILMHPKESTLNALDTILQYIEKANLKAITVSQNLL